MFAIYCLACHHELLPPNNKFCVLWGVFVWGLLLYFFSFIQLWSSLCIFPVLVFSYIAVHFSSQGHCIFLKYRKYTANSLWENPFSQLEHPIKKQTNKNGKPVFFRAKQILNDEVCSVWVLHVKPPSSSRLLYVFTVYIYVSNVFYSQWMVLVQTIKITRLMIWSMQEWCVLYVRHFGKQRWSSLFCWSQSLKVMVLSDDEKILWIIWKLRADIHFSDLKLRTTVDSHATMYSKVITCNKHTYIHIHSVCSC